MNDDEARKIIAEAAAKITGDLLLGAFASGTLPPNEPEPKPPLTMEIIQEAIDSIGSAPRDYTPAIPEIIYSEYIEEDVSYEELKFIPVYPCQMEIVKIGEKREHIIIVVDESKMTDWEPQPEAAGIPYAPLPNPFGFQFFGREREIDFQIPFPLMRRDPRRYIVAHPSSREAVEAMIKEMNK